MKASVKPPELPLAHHVEVGMAATVEFFISFYSGLAIFGMVMVLVVGTWRSPVGMGIIALGLGALPSFGLADRLKTMPLFSRRVTWAGTLIFHAGLAGYAFWQMGILGVILAVVEGIVVLHCLIGLAASLRSRQ